MKYYFEIITTNKEGAGTNSNFTIRFWGEKGQGDTFSLFSAIGKTKIENGEVLKFAVDSSTDAGCVNKIELTRDWQLLFFDGWAIDYIKVSKQPILNNQIVSVFQANTEISKPGETKTFNKPDGYPYSIVSKTSRYEVENGGMLFVPPSVHYNKTVSTDLNIMVNRSSVKTTDKNTGMSINISQQAVTSAFDEHINSSITETLDVSVNTTVQYTDTIDIDGGEKPLTYEILWQKEICTMSVEMGELIITFDIPKRKIFAGLRQVPDNKQNSVFDSIGIALTRKCTAQCEMCCFECGPDKEERLEKELVFRIIDEAAEIEEIRKIGFTGGEATLCADVLLEAIARTKQNGMKSSLTSNGVWGAGPGTAMEWLVRLKAAGLDSLTLSIDEYHQNYVPLESIRNIIRANREVRISLSLGVGDSLGERNAAALLQELKEDVYEFPIFLYPFMPVGRGEGLERILLQKVDGNWSCRNQRMLSILYDGSVYPCCSQAVYGSLLCEGNIREMSLKDIIDRYKYLSLFSELTRHKFGWLLAKAEEYQIPVNRESHSPCAFCHEIFTNQEFVERLRKELPISVLMAQDSGQKVIGTIGKDFQ
ncbi:MAG: radical SAM protein [Dorea sp.]|nr:radical SAM protein [Dorea sp.]